MGDIIEFGNFWDRLELEHMGREELLDCMEKLRAELERLDQQEPEDMDSEAYEDWGDRHEELEDLVDEVMDILDELED